MCFNRKIPCLPTVADKQGIRLKMHEMAISETLILKKFWGGGMGARTNTYDQHFGFSNLGSMPRASEAAGVWEALTSPPSSFQTSEENKSKATLL